MIEPPAREALGIIVEGEEVPGLIAYGLRPRGGHAGAVFPKHVWIASPEPTICMLHGEAWEVLMWEVPIVIWPTRVEMHMALTATLRALIDAGCRVAWIGAEGLPFCDPPQLFDPICMSGAVLAWMTDEGTDSCQLDPDAPTAPVGDDVLLALRSHAANLADVR